MNLKASSPIGKTSSKEPKCWFKSGSNPGDYEIGIDQTQAFQGKPCCYIKSRESPRGFSTLMQMFKAKSYLRNRIKLTGMAKSEGVEKWAGFWMRVDGPAKQPLSLDNMKDRSIKGTTGWTKYQIVLDVPEESVNIAFGLLLDGPGQVWMTDIHFETVSSSVPTTDLATDYPDNPCNLNFDE